MDAVNRVERYPSVLSETLASLVLPEGVNYAYE